MSTGDLTNNIKKLKSKLKSIKYTDEINITDLAEGTPTVYLPIYHHAFTSFSPALASLILNEDIELFGKSDARFMEAVYKVLRDIFLYKPPITQKQFFTQGFVERKVIMCTEILQKILEKHAALVPATSRTAHKMSVRPKSAAETKLHTAAEQKTKRPSTAKVTQRNQLRSPVPPFGHPQVVNELISKPGVVPVRHVASGLHRSNEEAGLTDNGQTSFSDLDIEPERTHKSCFVQKGETRVQRHVSIKTPPSSNRLESSLGSSPGFSGSGDNGSPEHLQSCYGYLNTPSISKVCREAVEVVSMPKGRPLEEDSMIEIRAVTGDSVLQATPPTSHTDLHTQIACLQQTIGFLTERVSQFENTYESAKTSHVENDAYVSSLEEKIRGQLDNLTARMLLLENRVSLLEVKVDGVTSGSSVQPAGAPASAPEVPPILSKQQLGDQSSFAEDLQSLTARSKFQSLMKETASDLSLNYSPIRKATNGVAGQIMSADEDTFALETEDDARRSSTPTFGGNLLGDSSIHCNFNDTHTKDAVSRITEIMKSTEMMLKSTVPTCNPDGETA